MHAYLHVFTHTNIAYMETQTHTLIFIVAPNSTILLSVASSVSFLSFAFCRHLVE